MEHEERQNVFFAFLLISFGALMAVCVSGNLVTLYLSFETLTLTTFPLVLHEMDRAAVAAGLKYLFYSVGGALLGLFAVFFVYSYASGDASFTYGGFLDSAKVAGHEGILLAAVFAGIVGFGTKAGMYPMHGWLPTAHPIAPAPASALLSAIIAKAGVVCVIRLVYFSVGAEFIRGTWVQTAWIILALLTIFMGSMMAFREKMLKKRLAYSSVSQISYIMLGLAMLSDEGLRGGLIHLMSHAASKGTLFMVAGIFIVKLGIRDVGLLKGVGRRMPVTMWCFMIASLSLVGIPPMGGFVAKYYLAHVSTDFVVAAQYVGKALCLLAQLLCLLHHHQHLLTKRSRMGCALLLVFTDSLLHVGDSILQWLRDARYCFGIRLLQFLGTLLQQLLSHILKALLMALRLFSHLLMQQLLLSLLRKLYS